MSQSTLSVSRVSNHSHLARSRAWISILLLTPAGLLTLSSPTHFAGESWGSVGCECAGWMLFLMGAVFRWWATLYIGGHKDRDLATDGAYSVTRNPLYFGTFLMLMAVGVMLQSLSFIATSLVVAAIYILITVPEEERRLSDRFGETFDQYCERVPRFFPRMSLLESPAVVEVRAKGLYAEWTRMARWMLVPMLCHGVLHLRTLPWWPHYLQLP